MPPEGDTCKCKPGAQYQRGEGSGHPSSQGFQGDLQGPGSGTHKGARREHKAVAVAALGALSAGRSPCIISNQRPSQSKTRTGRQAVSWGPGSQDKEDLQGSLKIGGELGREVHFVTTSNLIFLSRLICSSSPSTQEEKHTVSPLDSLRFG